MRRKVTTPWAIRLLEILSDGEWHDYEIIRDQVARLVPPGTAYRQAEKNRQSHYTRSGLEPKERVYGDRNDTILSGQRYFVTKSIQDLRRSGRIEVEYGSQPKRKRPVRLRLTPE